MAASDPPAGSFVYNDLLAQFLGPERAADFFSDYWLQRPLYVSAASRENSRNSANETDILAQDNREEKKQRNHTRTTVYHPYFTLSDVEAMWINAMQAEQEQLDNPLLFTSSIEAMEDNREIGNNKNDCPVDKNNHDKNRGIGSTCPPRSRFVDVKNPFFAYPHGCSVIVNRADLYSPRVHQLCCALQTQQFPLVYCNVYVTPPNRQQTARPHSDDRDVIILQISGKKEWTVYKDPPVHLPYRHEEVGKISEANANSNSQHHMHGCGINRLLDTSQMEVALRTVVGPGDLLYCPRGWVHEARTVATDETDSESLSSFEASEGSVHLTMAIQSSDWDHNALLRDAVAKLCKESSSLAPGGKAVLHPEMLAQASRSIHSVETMPTAHGHNAGYSERQRSQFNEFFQAIASCLNFDFCLSAWSQRVSDISRQRDDTAAARQGWVVSTQGTRQPPPFAPLELKSLLMWNPDVFLLSVRPSRDVQVPSIAWIAVLGKIPWEHSHEGRGQSMAIALSDDTRRLLMFTSRTYHTVWSEAETGAEAAVRSLKSKVAEVSRTTAPFAVGELLQLGLPGGVLAVLSACNWLLRNSCLLRIG